MSIRKLVCHDGWFHCPANPFDFSTPFDFYANFFAKCEIGEVFTYVSAHDLRTVETLARTHGVVVRYCEPHTDEYKAHGGFTVKVVGKALTAKDIESIKEGTIIHRTLDLMPGMFPKADARWSRPEPVVEVIARGVNKAGMQFVCFYTQYGENARMSGSASEGEAHIRIDPLN